MKPTGHALTLKTVDGYYSAFNRGDMDGMLTFLDDDVVHEINQGDVEKGKAAFARFLETMDRHFREEVADLVVMASLDGQRAAAEFKVRGVYLQTHPGLPEARSQAYTLPVGAFFEMQGAKIVRVSTYYNLRAWLAMMDS